MRSNADETYFSVLHNVLENGVEKTDRTGTGTISLAGQMMRFDLSKGEFPLLTTKRMFWKGVVEELLWMISGSTDASLLSSKGVRIWDANGTRSFLDKNGFHDREVNDLGPIYGFQWRHYGAEYKGKDHDYTDQGIDQLAQAIRMIKETPDSRRIIVCSWNASDIGKMALPPCHVMYQFIVNGNQLSCVMTQRSGDLGLGIPFNIAFYSLLTTMVAQVCSLIPGELIITIGDAHIYKNHIDQLRIQMERTPFPSPHIVLDPTIRTIDDFDSSHIILTNYESHPTISMPMAV